MTDEDFVSRSARLHLDAIAVLTSLIEEGHSAEAELRRSIAVLQNDRDFDGSSATQSASDTVGFIDQTIYANEDSSPDVSWKNSEVLELLGDIRARIVPKVPRADADAAILETQKLLGCQESQNSCWKHGGYWNGSCHHAESIAKKELGVDA